MASIPDHTLPFNALDDYSVNLAIYELQHGPVRYDPERLSSLNYELSLRYVHLGDGQTINLV